MVGTVRGKLFADLSIKDILSALFPGGSVTGLPKIRAMELLSMLEKKARNIYCGAIGFIAPATIMHFSVAIRTLSLFPAQRVVFNAGSGIIYDSTGETEYAECLLKARFATDNPS